MPSDIDAVGPRRIAASPRRHLGTLGGAQRRPAGGLPQEALRGPVVGLAARVEGVTIALRRGFTFRLAAGRRPTGKFRCPPKDRHTCNISFESIALFLRADPRELAVIVRPIVGGADQRKIAVVVAAARVVMDNLIIFTDGTAGRYPTPRADDKIPVAQNTAEALTGGNALILRGTLPVLAIVLAHPVRQLPFRGTLPVEEYVTTALDGAARRYVGKIAENNNAVLQLATEAERSGYAILLRGTRAIAGAFVAAFSATRP